MYPNVSMVVIILRLGIMNFSPFFELFRKVVILIFLKIALLKESLSGAMIYRWQGDWGLEWAEVYFEIVLSNMLTISHT